jgi:hypothetical protein
MVDAHDQNIVNRYIVHYPAHPARQDDPHYVDFEHIRKAWKADPEKWQCSMGKKRNDFSECSLDQPLELHHSHIEFSLQNGVDFEWLESQYPGISNSEQVGAWVESAENLVVFCVNHHRGSGGVHHASASDFEAENFVRGLIGSTTVKE